MVLEKTLESPWYYSEIKQVNPKENQSRILIGRTDSEAEVPIPWPPDEKNPLFGKDPDAVKDRKQIASLCLKKKKKERKKTGAEGDTEDEMVG